MMICPTNAGSADYNFECHMTDDNLIEKSEMWLQARLETKNNNE
jgi:hypothetical protein